ncbi:MAG: hypothetical protein QOI66_5344, partial [Myxococcales bacterium]|nr:hypothetical protein [Myxococcales bacterium]
QVEAHLPERDTLEHNEMITHAGPHR